MPASDASLALVLSGGGARGAFEAGVVAAMQDAGLRPGIVSGTSAGALTGAAVAAGWDAARLCELWTSLQSRDVYRPRLDVHRLLHARRLLVDPRRLLGFGGASTSETLLDLIAWTWLFHLRPLRERLVEELGGVRLPLLDDVTFTVSAVDVADGGLVRFANRPVPDQDRDAAGSNRVVDLGVDHVLASAAIPGLFQPIEVDGRTYWDGGLTSATPLTAALAHDPDHVVVVGTSPETGGDRPPASFGDVLALSLDHVFRSALLQDVDHARTVNELVEAAPDATPHRQVAITAIVPDDGVDGLGDLLDFEPVVAEQLVEAGRRIGRERLGAAGLA